MSRVVPGMGEYVMAKKKSRATCAAQATDRKKKVFLELRCYPSSYVCSGRLVAEGANTVIAPGSNRPGSDADLTWAVDPITEVYSLGVGALLRPGLDEDDVEFELTIVQADAELAKPVSIEGEALDEDAPLQSGYFRIRMKAAP